MIIVIQIALNIRLRISIAHQSMNHRTNQLRALSSLDICQENREDVLPSTPDMGKADAAVLEVADNAYSSDRIEPLL